MATYYVRNGAAGADDGSNWNNAYPDLPASLVRGNTYYIADGSYASYVFNDAESSTTLITIKKATIANHGTDTGWDNAYGDGQATFTAPLKFVTSYWVFDGVTRNESDWFDGTAYGFKVLSSASDYAQSIKIGGMDSGGGYDYGGGQAAHGVQVKYTFVQAAVLPTFNTRSYQFDLESGTTVTGVVISHCFVKDGNNHYFLRKSSGAIVEYCASTAALSSSANDNHGEIVNLYYNTPNAIIRYNKFYDNFTPGYVITDFPPFDYSAGTAVIAIVISDNCQIYGNIFANNCTTDACVGWNANQIENAVTNLKFYNNTIVSGWGSQGIILEPHSSNCQVYNNIWYPDGTFQAVTHDYNASSSDLGETNDQIINTSIFVDYLNRDYRLAAATTSGVSLSSPYNTDLFGNIRGLDGKWDRGAYEFVTSQLLTPLDSIGMFLSFY